MTATANARATAGLAGIVEDLLGRELPIAVECFDGTRTGPPDAPTKLVVRSTDALRRILTAPGELGFGRAYVAGDLDVEGDIYAALELRKHLPTVRLTAAQWGALARLVGTAGVRPLPPPSEEARLGGRRHTKGRDAAAIAHHYDVSNDFYRLVLGPSMTYSCAVWPAPDTTLDQAQAAKYELIARKLDLRPGQRLLDVGCGWGGMAMHAARHHGVEAVGVTVSSRQVEWARRAVAEAGLADRVDIRLQDYREIADGPYDAISSIGMFEHVGAARLDEYFARLYGLLRPGGRLLNHGIARRPGPRARFSRHGFIDRYVFPDGELHEIGSVVSRIQAAGFEVRHVESLREHYERTLRAWVDNLERSWDEAVALVGPGRARVWRLYMAASAVGFGDGGTEVHQALAVRSQEGRSGMPPRPTWDCDALVPGPS
ncbi:MAG: class I SAM-dependent methyltransferase [Actinobacteria bacterium]|nr:class I SAM-dependent methyltransferase [Actinomycetota bacterium]